MATGSLGWSQSISSMALLSIFLELVRRMLLRNLSDRGCTRAACMLSVESPSSRSIYLVGISTALTSGAVVHEAARTAERMCLATM